MCRVGLCNRRLWRTPKAAPDAKLHLGRQTRRVSRASAASLAALSMDFEADR